MYSVMMTGYMFRNAQYRLELQQSLEQVALPEAQERKASYFLSPLLFDDLYIVCPFIFHIISGVVFIFMWIMRDTC